MPINGYFLTLTAIIPEIAPTTVKRARSIRKPVPNDAAPKRRKIR